MKIEKSNNVGYADGAQRETQQGRGSIIIHDDQPHFEARTFRLVGHGDTAEQLTHGVMLMTLDGAGLYVAMSSDSMRSLAAQMLRLADHVDETGKKMADDLMAKVMSKNTNTNTNTSEGE